MAGAERNSYVIRSSLNAMPLAIGFAVMLFPLRDILPGLVSEAGRIAEFGVLAAVGVSSLLGIVSALQGWAQARPFLASLARFLDAPERLREGGRKGVDVARATIVFDEVSVRHDGATEGTPHAFSCRWLPERGLALLGDNGAGKSSLAWCLLGLLHPRLGTLSFDDLPSDEVDWSTFRSKLVFVPQHGFVAPERSVAWHLRLLSSSELSDEAIDRALEAVQLDRTLGRDAPLRDALVGDLSGGERKRVQLARALLGGPELIVLDEPEAGLDANSREWLKTFVQGLSEQCRVLLIAHDEKVIPASFQTMSCERHPLAPFEDKKK
jgi:ABC-type transport system involved in cytochrome bd biosynthesis fused ATPase/permease subunit